MKDGTESEGKPTRREGEEAAEDGEQRAAWHERPRTRGDAEPRPFLSRPEHAGAVRWLARAPYSVVTLSVEWVGRVLARAAPPRSSGTPRLEHLPNRHPCSLRWTTRPSLLPCRAVITWRDTRRRLHA